MRASCGHRSCVFSSKGMVAASQPLAVDAGLRILRDLKGNAMDAAIAVAAALQVTEPCSTGMGGDCFMLYYDAASKSVSAVNGSGKSARKGPSLKDLRTSLGVRSEDQFPDPCDARTVTVPGAVMGWEDGLKKFGTLEFKDVLAPAIELAEKGFPVAPIAAHFWKQGRAKLLRANQNTKTATELLVPEDDSETSYRAPRAGELFRNPHVASVFRDIAKHGARKGFYAGRAGAAIVEAVRVNGGCLSVDDLHAHSSSFPRPMSTRYRGIDVWEHPPNGQGLCALIALAILDGIDLDDANGVSSPSRLHHLIESLRLGFADTRYYVCDPDFDEDDEAPEVTSKPAMRRCEDLLAPSYVSRRRALIDSRRASVDVKRGSPFASSDTVSFQVVDQFGNAVSFVNSNYQGFGTGIVPQGCGFTLQNRGHNFSLDPDHPNRYAPGKRPYHTIIPGLATYPDGTLFCSFTNMGGFMQPQGHVQLLSNMLDLHLDPQSAISAPRFCIPDGRSNGEIVMEIGHPASTMEVLRKMGHNVRAEPVQGAARSVFGRAQIIVRDRRSGVLCGGSDDRADGLAMGHT